ILASPLPALLSTLSLTLYPLTVTVLHLLYLPSCNRPQGLTEFGGVPGPPLR
ncbi:unnamed protein product, partial [Amoebophrya sp. A120]